jgi:glycosyltransferase involved in cell wall biosynthesis
VDWFLDRPRLLKAAGNMGAGTPPAKLAGMTKAMIRGARGGMGKELKRLTTMLRALKPDVISLPNLMMAGVAEELKKELKVPIVVELTGEDIFFEAMAPEDQRELRELVRACLPHVAGLVATSNHYATKMAEYLGVKTGTIQTVYGGVPAALLEAPSSGTPVTSPFRIGHLARIDPPKGLEGAHAIVDRIRELGTPAELHYAGWEGPQHRKWHASIRAAAKAPGTYHGEVDLAGKIQLLDSLGIFLAPAPYPEPKGLYVLEAMARGAPVVAANHGVFPEIVGDAGTLVAPGDIDSFARNIIELIGNVDRRNAMSAAGRAAVAARFTDQRMASNMLAFYASLL